MKPWTMMIYMVAVHGLNRPARRDIAEVRKVSRSLGDLVDVAVQVDYSNTEPRRHRFPPTGRRMPRVRETNVANGKALVDFVKWARAECPSQRVMLVLWGHQYRFGYGMEHGRSLTIPALASALHKAKELLPGKRIDVLGCDACGMATAECVYELRDVANYLIAPQFAIPTTGFPYDAMLETLVRELGNNPRLGPAQVARLMLDAFETAYATRHPKRQVTLSLVNLARAGELRSVFAALFQALNKQTANGRHAQPVVRAFDESRPFDGANTSQRYNLSDLQTLCRRLMEHAPDEDVSNAAIEVQKLVRPGGPLLRDCRRRPEQLGLANGLSVYTTDSSGRRFWDYLDKHYSKLALPAESEWSTLLQNWAAPIARQRLARQKNRKEVARR